jgi:hypothetical protein
VANEASRPRPGVARFCVKWRLISVSAVECRAQLQSKVHARDAAAVPKVPTLCTRAAQKCCNFHRGAAGYNIAHTCRAKLPELPRVSRLHGTQFRSTTRVRQYAAAFSGLARSSCASRGVQRLHGVVDDQRSRLPHAYDKQGLRRQKSLGPRSDKTEKIKADFEKARGEAERRLQTIQPVMVRQAAVNRALGLGRVPLLSARIIRGLDASGLLGAGIRVIGTNAVYAYEATAGVHIDPGLTTTEDVDLLLDSRARLSFVASEDVEDASLLRILQRVDKSFSRSRENFRAINEEGYLVDLIKPLRDPPWADEAARVGNDPDDLSAVEISGLSWRESAPAFASTAIDERGGPLRIVTSDPRVFAAHKYWLSKRDDREPVKRRRDLMQARAVAALVAAHMPQLPFAWEQVRM